MSVNKRTNIEYLYNELLVSNIEYLYNEYLYNELLVSDKGKQMTYMWNCIMMSERT